MASSVSWSSYAQLNLGPAWTSFYFNRPTEVTTGDVLLVFAAMQSGTINTPAGWTLQRTYLNGVRLYLFSRVVTNIGTEPSQYSFTGSSMYGKAVLIGHAGVNNSTPVSVVSTGYGDGSSQSVTFMNQAISLAAGATYLTFLGSVGSVSASWFGSNVSEMVDASGPYASIGMARGDVSSATTTPVSTGETSSGTYKATITIGLTPVATAPLAPTLLNPTGGEDYPRQASQTWEWQYNGADHLPQASALLQYRVYGTSTWTDITISGSAQSYFMPSGFGADGTRYEWRVTTTNTAGLTSPASAVETFWARNNPPDPVITSPADGGTVSASHNVTWTVTSQDAYRIRVLSNDNSDGNMPALPILYDSGVVVSSSTRSHTASFPVNGVLVWIEATVRVNGIWSGGAYHLVNVSYILPMAPTSLSFSPVLYGIPNNTTAMQVQFTNPTPSGGAPYVVQAELWVRNAWANDAGWKVATFGSQGAPNPWRYTWHFPAFNYLYDYKVVVIGYTGAKRETSWATANGVATLSSGCVLQDVTDPFWQGAHVPLNDTGASEYLEVESALIDVQGRTHPMVEWGAGEHKTIDIPIAHSEAIVDDGGGSTQTQSEAAYKVQQIMKRKNIICYRDNKGRVEFGRLRQGDIKDKFYGHVTSFQLDVVDFDNGDFFTTAAS